MAIRQTAGNSFRVASNAGVRQRVARKNSYELPGGLLLWQITGKIILVFLPIIFAINMICSVVISSQTEKIAHLHAEIMTAQQVEEGLQSELTTLSSPEHVAAMAKEFGLVKATEDNKMSLILK